jgi:uncharacterized membrane protein
MHRQTLKKNSILFCALFLVALSVHLPGITFHSLWFDETSTAYMVSQPGIGNTLKALYTFEGTPPLFFLLEKSVIHVFHLPVNEFSLRILPMLYGTLSCVLIFFLFREIASTKTALLTFCLVTISNFFMYLFQEARCYSLLCLMALLTLWLVIQWWKKASLLRTVALFVSITVLVQVHYYALFWVTALCVSAFVIKPKNRQFFGFLILNGVAALISFIPLFLLFMTQFNHEVGTIRSYLTMNWFLGIFYAPIKVLIGAYLFKIYEIKEITPVDMIGIFPCAIILLAAAGFLFMRLRNKTLSDPEKFMYLSCILAFVIHVILGSKVPTIHPRYMAHFLILLFGIVLVSLEGRKKLQVSVFSVLFILNVVATVKYYDVSKAYIEPWRDIAHCVDSALSADSVKADPIIGNYVNCHTIAFYLKNKTSELYCVPSYSSKTSFARLNVFGSTCYTSLFHYKYYPVLGETSFMDIIKTKKRGILVSKDKSGDLAIDTLESNLKGLVDFSTVGVFKTNQGDVSILRWTYRPET